MLFKIMLFKYNRIISDILPPLKHVGSQTELL